MKTTDRPSKRRALKMRVKILEELNDALRKENDLLKQKLQFINCIMAANRGSTT